MNICASTDLEHLFKERGNLKKCVILKEQQSYFLRAKILVKVKLVLQSVQQILQLYYHYSPPL